MVRQIILEQFGEDAYKQGLEITTTLDSAQQIAAEKALKEQILAYDRRHGYRGVWGVFKNINDNAEALIALNDMPRPYPLIPALVVQANANQATLLLANGESASLQLNDVRWARAYIDEDRQGRTPTSVAEVIPKGSLIHVKPKNNGFELAQIPEVNGAIVSIQPQTGAIQSLVGGYDYSLSQYNRVTQAKRQPGQSWRPALPAPASATAAATLKPR